MLGLLFAASGLTALVYQLVWTRWAGLVLGHFAPAAAVVVATWMAGLAAGNWVLGRAAERLSPGKALRLYAVMEGALAAIAAVSPWIFHGSAPVYLAMAGTGTGWLARAVWCAVLLLPPTVLMGGTLPAVVQAAGASGPGQLARLYALNTAGAAAGPVLAAFVLMPVFGIRTTLWLACGLNAVVAVAAWRLAPRADGTASPAAPSGGREGAPLFPCVLGACSGFLALGFEVALTRLVTLTITLTSVYGFAIVLSVFLLGMAGGAWLARKRPPQAGNVLAAFAIALAIPWGWALAASCWGFLPPLLIGMWERFGGFGGRVLLGGIVTMAVLLPLPAAFGYALPVLAGVPGFGGAAAVGRLFAANTAGAIAGALAVGFLALPRFGLAGTIQGLGILSILLAGTAGWAARPRVRTWLPFAVAGLLAMNAVVPEPDPVTMNAGLALRPRRDILDAARAGRAAVVYERDGLSGRVSVIADAPGSLVFAIDGAPNASTSPEDQLTQMTLAYLPAVVAARPRRALVIGLGAGMTAGSLSLFPGLDEVRIAEIEPAQAGVAAVFGEFNHGVLSRPNVTVQFDDARHFLLAERGSFDVISSDPADLFVGGMVNLYTVEFYRLVRARLASGGAFVQWFHAYHLDREDLRGILRTALEVFPRAGLWVEPHGDLILLAMDEPFRVDLEAWERRLGDPAVAADLARAGLKPPSDLAGFCLWGPADLARWAKGARLCTDADPYLEFTTPRRPFSRRDQNRLGREVALFAPLDPVPLARESASARLRMARLALGHGFLARARAECRRGLELAPGRRDLLSLLARVDEVEHAASTRQEPRE